MTPVSFFCGGGGGGVLTHRIQPIVNRSTKMFLTLRYL